MTAAVPDSLAGTTAIVTGASRGFGRAVSAALLDAGVRVVGVARTGADLDDVRKTLGEGFVPVPGDAADGGLAAKLIAEYRPRTLVLCAGAMPTMTPLPRHTWASFSRNWNVDVRHAFEWVGAALRQPLAPGSSVVAFSSGAALKGSPLSGGYAGAKSTIRFITSYAALESQRADLGIDFVSILPQLTPATDLGAEAVAAYAAAQGVDVDAFVTSMGAVVTPELAARCVVGLAESPGQHVAYALTGDGIRGLE
ncbi:MAG TPA: SDR family oxidoreductase [Mycobacterium sp.]|jgi:NAD(P)-dependent dehydrogenase (short-subunit alcohol dehydrogenase family)|nr:SDR family oxidoreductase [Mycobacterium sp.]